VISTLWKYDEVKMSYMIECLMHLMHLMVELIFQTMMNKNFGVAYYHYSCYVQREW